jgi:hypothetical protein
VRSLGTPDHWNGPKHDFRFRAPGWPLSRRRQFSSWHKAEGFGSATIAAAIHGYNRHAEWVRGIAALDVDGACASVRVRLLLIAIAGLRRSLCTVRAAHWRVVAVN